MTLIATAGAADANSYITQVEASSSLSEGRLYLDVWNAAKASKKETALIWATRILDEGMNWFTLPTTSTQALRWPQHSATDLDGAALSTTAIPTQVKWATMELALLLLEGDRTRNPTILEKGFERAKVDELNVAMNKSFVPDVIPDYIALQLRSLGKPSPAAAGADGTVYLKRG